VLGWKVGIYDDKLSGWISIEPASNDLVDVAVSESVTDHDQKVAGIEHPNELSEEGKEWSLRPQLLTLSKHDCRECRI
jgi:hypothetical protein